MPGFFEKEGVRSFAKAAIVIVLLLLLLIPLSMVKSLVWERELRSRDVEAEIIGSSGGGLDLVGPVLVLPYDLLKQTFRDGIRTTEQIRGGEIFVVPEDAAVSVRLKTEYRSRGIYQVPVYDAFVEFQGTLPALTADYLPDGAILKPEEIRLFTGFADMRGIRSISELTLGDNKLDFHPDTGVADLGNGISASLRDIDIQTASLPFSWTMKIAGGGSVSATPLGRNSRLEVRGDWSSPSFGGSVLPDERDVNDDGFSASWLIPEVSRPIGSHFSFDPEEGPFLRRNALSVELMDPVGTYDPARRSVQYGVLFLILPFVVFFLFEAFGSARIHPVQYLLAGAADTVFYMLLLAVSEHLGFNLAYLIAAAASTLLLSLYTLQITGRSLQGLIMPVVLGGAYVWLWVSLQSEDYALLIGAIGLFILVAAVMLITRKVDWYMTAKSVHKDTRVPRSLGNSIESKK